MLRGFLDLPDGMAIRIGAAGLLLGRHRSCDLQLAAESASRRHALLRNADDGVELIVLGRQPVEVDGRTVTATEMLANGARLSFPGLVCHVRVEHADESVPVEFVLRRGGERFPIRTSPFVIGDAAMAHVVVDGWPADVIRLRVAQGELFAELGEPGLHNGDELAADTPTALRDGDSLEVRGQSFRIERAADDSASTVSSSDTRVRGVILAPLPRGGRVTFSFADGDRTVYLPGRRYRIMAALLVPPPPLCAGDYIPDSELVPLVWNDTDEVGGRMEINVVLTRTRQDLVAAGIAATTVIERAPGGRATRVVLGPGAAIRTVE